MQGYYNHKWLTLLSSSPSLPFLRTPPLPPFLSSDPFPSTRPPLCSASSYLNCFQSYLPPPSSPAAPTILPLLLSILYLPHPAPFYPLPSSPCSFLSPTIPHISPLPYTIFPCFSHFLSPLKIVTSLPSPTSPYLSQSSVPGLYLYVG